MVEKTIPNLKGIPETLLIPLYTRALETRRPDAMLKDEIAVQIVERMEYDFSRLELHGHDAVGVILRVRQFDNYAKVFLARHPAAAVVHIGCGLDTRFERVDNGLVEWFDLDFPEVVALRHSLIGDERPRYHLIAGSVLEDAWLEALNGSLQRPFLFMAEGVFPYFDEDQLKSLFLKLRDHFPGAELVCDAHTPFVIWADNLQLAAAGVKARLRWGLKQGKDVESWGEGIELLDEWFYFNDPEPRMRPWRWMRFIPLMGKSTGIFHYRLGIAP